MALGTMMYVKSSEDLAETLGDPKEAIGVFQRRATDCLLIAKYSSNPGAYTMEALLMNAQNEFLRRKDAHLGVWVLGGIAIRLAMRMGYRTYSCRLFRIICRGEAASCSRISLIYVRPRPFLLRADLALRRGNAPKNLDDDAIRRWLDLVPTWPSAHDSGVVV